MTTKQTSVFIHVKYVKYKMEYRTLTFCFMQHRQGGLIAPWKTSRCDWEISFGFTLKCCCGFTGCFINLSLHYPCISGSSSQNYLWSHAFFMRISYSPTCLISFYPLSIKQVLPDLSTGLFLHKPNNKHPRKIHPTCPPPLALHLHPLNSFSTKPKRFVTILLSLLIHLRTWSS